MTGEIRAKTKYLKISPRKMVGLCKLVRDQNIAVAKTILLRSPKKGSKIILKTINSAVANAKNKNLSEKGLFIYKISADQGPSLKRWIPWSRGRARPIKKRTTHLTVVLREKEDEKKKTLKKKSSNSLDKNKDKLSESRKVEDKVEPKKEEKADNKKVKKEEKDKESKKTKAKKL